jgi:hypothetical protein
MTIQLSISASQGRATISGSNGQVLGLTGLAGTTRFGLGIRAI